MWDLRTSLVIIIFDFGRGGIFAICLLYLIWFLQSESRFFLFKTAYLSNNRFANAWFSFSILSVSLLRLIIFKLIGPFGFTFTEWVLLAAVLFAPADTLLHFPLLISTSLLRRIWLSLLMVIFRSFVRNSFVFYRSCLFFLIFWVISFASLIALFDAAIWLIFFWCYCISFSRIIFSAWLLSIQVGACIF